jgi:hypothetical protein
MTYLAVDSPEPPLEGLHLVQQRVPLPLVVLDQRLALIDILHNDEQE